MASKQVKQVVETETSETLRARREEIVADIAAQRDELARLQNQRGVTALDAPDTLQPLLERIEQLKRSIESTTLALPILDGRIEVAVRAEANAAREEAAARHEQLREKRAELGKQLLRATADGAPESEIRAIITEGVRTALGLIETGQKMGLTGKLITQFSSFVFEPPANAIANPREWRFRELRKHYLGS